MMLILVWLTPAQVEPLKYKLTQRQHMVLFLYLQKYSYSEIASILATLGHKISAGRVNDRRKPQIYFCGKD